MIECSHLWIGGMAYPNIQQIINRISTLKPKRKTMGASEREEDHVGQRERKTLGATEREEDHGSQ